MRSNAQRGDILTLFQSVLFKRSGKHLDSELQIAFSGVTFVRMSEHLLPHSIPLSKVVTQIHQLRFILLLLPRDLNLIITSDQDHGT